MFMYFLREGCAFDVANPKDAREKLNLRILFHFFFGFSFGFPEFVWISNWSGA